MIVGVAVKLGDGRVLSLPRPARHCHLFAEYNERAQTPWEGWPGSLIREGEQGFVDDQGVFLNRREAARHAFYCDQIAMATNGLFSEDVW